MGRPTSTEPILVDAFGRAYRRWNAREGRIRRAPLVASYYAFIVLPYPLRRVAVAAYVQAVLWLKHWTGIETQSDLTPLDEIGTLSFWGVPDIDLTTYTLTVDGAVESPLLLRYGELLELPSELRRLRMDCVGGFRNNIEVRGIMLAELLARARPLERARRAIFYCADGYFESSSLAELDSTGAMLVFETNGEKISRLGYPLRVAIPGKYGYKWAKWVQRVEIVTHDRKGYWPQRGLPDRANIGDRW